MIVLVILGWAIARDVGRSLGPPLFRRLDPATAGTVGFLIRLVTIVVALLVALRVAGIEPRTLALGGAFTAVIFGLAAQQTLGNLIAGTVLLSARPFRVGDRVRLQGGPLAGQIEGTVSSLGLLYTTLRAGRGLDHGAQQRRPQRRRAAAARARGGRPARAPARRDDARATCRRSSRGRCTTPLRDAAADHARGARRRRGRRAHRRHARWSRHRAVSSRAELLDIVSRETRSAPRRTA